MRLIIKIYHLIVDIKIPTLSGGLCFFILINGGSYLFLFVSLFSYFPIDVLDIINTYLKDGIFKEIIVYLFLHNANLSTSLFLLATSIYSSSSLYYHFMHSCELITKKPIDNRIGKRIQSLILVPLMLLLVFILTISIYMLFLMVGSITYILLIPVLFLFLLFLNRIALRGYSLKRIYKGALFSFLYIVIFTVLFIIYLMLYSDFKIVYGILSFFIVFLFYLYIVIIGVLIGIYINCKNLEVFNFVFDKK